jgi:hypothetical protein
VGRAKKNPVRRKRGSKRVKGVEPDKNPAFPPRKTPEEEAGAAKASVAPFPPIPADADLAEVVKAWPNLTAAVKAGIMAMVEASP